MSEPLRDLARRAVESGWRRRGNGDPRPHYVVCGQDALAYHVVKQLLATELRAGTVRVTVVVTQRGGSDGPDIRSVRGIRIVRADRLDEETFRRAGLVGADGLALLHQDDVGNIHAAYCAQAVDPEVRLVLRMFNTRLAGGVRQLFPSSAVLSDASMAAPAFVAAALGEVAPTYFRHQGRTLQVARRADVRPEDVVCGVADMRDPRFVRVLPADESTADVVLAEATGQPTGTELAARRLVAARRRRPLLMTVRALRSFASRKLGIATIAVLGVIALLGYLISRAEEVSPGEALYLTLVTTLSGADPDTGKDAAAQIMQVVLNLAGLALIPLITAVVVDGIVNARLALHAGRAEAERSGHVVVVGLGNVGTRVMAQLRDFGVEVVAIDKDPEARGAALARRLGVPLIEGDAALEETLRAAWVQTCQALVVVSTDDVANLQAALNGRAVNDDLRVVLRLFDDDFAERISSAFDIGISRSVSYLAAPSFTGALLNRVVIATIPLERHVLVVAEVPVAAGAALDGAPLAEVDQPEGVRLIGHTPAGQVGQSGVDWSPDARMVINAGDRLTVVARRAGLSWLLRQTSPPPPVLPPTPSTPPAPRTPGPDRTRPEAP
ncbi:MULTISPECIES: potassium channel family protein [Micromonospora]|uniref:Trk K+ transport system, NAD-binding component n=1 Tax=Micromonospora yangpuensis TaxID=683228 RepID=A0A1C6VEH7_9ACTN|nr:NAD-binding protein [Micromonospora yangpuensis]GGM13920.1 potassium transporter TrkA [Micromonospora yangpuensis]SCL64424.1 Trk K+ transport system, NAD-binding component [Micromonospora yangpuensis]